MKFIFFAFVIVFAIACGSQPATSEKAVSDSTSTASSSEKFDYPYTLDKPYKNWQTGNQEHAVNVLKMLKAWETKNVAECAGYFGDSVEFVLDYYHKKIPHDSVPAAIEGSLAKYASVKLKMEDWESVISSDKKDEWVTVWYKQVWVDKNGKSDSLSCVDD